MPSILCADIEQATSRGDDGRIRVLEMRQTGHCVHRGDRTLQSTGSKLCFQLYGSFEGATECRTETTEMTVHS
jgi:hypothetical protein